MSIAHPLRNPADWGRVLVGGSQLPGIMTESVVPPRVWEWAIQQGYGQSKVTIYKATGILDEITFTHFLNLKTTGADDWDALTSTFLPTLIPGWPNAYQGKPRSFPVVHPAIQFLGGKRIHLSKMFAPEPPQGEKIPQYYKLVFQEDVPQKIIPAGKPEPAKLNGPPAPKDALEASVAKALETFTSGGGISSLFSG